MKTVLWVSRHQMTADQRADLERIMGEQVQLVQWSSTVNAVEELLPALESADAVAAVLPVELLADLVAAADGKPVLQAVTERRPTGRTITLPDGRTEAEFAYRYAGWQQVVRLELELKRL